MDTGTAARLDEFTRYLDANNFWYKKDYQIKYETYFKMGGVVKVFACPQSVAELQSIVRHLRGVGLPFKVIGLTSNVLLLEQVEYGVLISTRNIMGIEVAEDCFVCDCGYPLQDFVRVAIMAGASGYEGLEGIPGSIGGALVMNAGAYGYEISDHIICVDCIDAGGHLRSFTKAECGFNHRSSRFSDGSLVILRAKFRIVKGDRKAIERRVEAFHIARHSYQEFVYPSLGSLFSVKRGFYGELFQKNRFYLAVYLLLKALLKNPVSRFISRKRPNNALFNLLSSRYIKNENYIPSPKSMNILINDGRTPLRELVNYISRVRLHLDEKTRIENEFVVEPVVSVEPDFEPLYKRIKGEMCRRH